jgi:hypothetical protein
MNRTKDKVVPVIGESLRRLGLRRHMGLLLYEWTQTAGWVVKRLSLSSAYPIPK